jgi:hypothetical protein
LIHSWILLWNWHTTILGATSHKSQGLWPCNCEGYWFLSKSRTTNMVCWNLRQAYLLKADLMQSSTNNETLFIVCHVGIHVDLSSMIISLGPFVGSHLHGLGLLPFRPMRDLRMQRPRALSLSCGGGWPLSTTLQRAGTWSPRIGRVIFDFWEDMTLGWLPEGHCWACRRSERASCVMKPLEAPH